MLNILQIALLENHHLVTDEICHYIS